MTTALHPIAAAQTMDAASPCTPPCPRVVALIGNHNVDTSTALTGVFNTNNPSQRGDGRWLVVLRIGPGRQQNRHHLTIPASASFDYVSPESYFFASPTVVYVTDSGQPKKPGAGPVAQYADRAEVATKPGVARHYGRSSCSARMLLD